MAIKNIVSLHWGKYKTLGELISSVPEFKALSFSATKSNNAWRLVYA